MDELLGEVLRREAGQQPVGKARRIVGVFVRLLPLSTPAAAESVPDCASCGRERCARLVDTAERRFLWILGRDVRCHPVQ